MKVQVTKENEMLQSVISWTERTEKKEKEVWAEVGRCWGVWEQAQWVAIFSDPRWTCS